MPHKPTLVFVPGAWHGAETWDQVSSVLEAQQYKCVRVTLPSTLSNPDATYLDDMNAVRDAIVAETTQGGDVVLVAHSYGGYLASSAVKGLTRKTQDASLATKESSGHAIGIAMVASGFNTTGLDLIDSFGGAPPPQWSVNEKSGFVSIAVDAREMFYQDLPAAEGAQWVDKLREQAWKPVVEGGEHAYSGWMDVPVWYLATTEDRAMPVELQHASVQLARDAGADVTLREIGSSHSPMLSRPKETADFVLQAVASFTG